MHPPACTQKYLSAYAQTHLSANCTQPLEEKQRETQLKKDAEERNDRLTESEKKSTQWKAIGGRGRRHIALLPIRM